MKVICFLIVVCLGSQFSLIKDGGNPPPPPGGGTGTAWTHNMQGNLAWRNQSDLSSNGNGPKWKAWTAEMFEYGSIGPVEWQTRKEQDNGIVDGNEDYSGKYKISEIEMGIQWTTNPIINRFKSVLSDTAGNVFAPPPNGPGDTEFGGFLGPGL